MVLSMATSGCGMLADIGETTGFIESSLRGCDALFLEANHCEDMLANSRYPAEPEGAYCRTLRALVQPGRRAAAGKAGAQRSAARRCSHLSRENNRPDLAREAFSNALGGDAQDIHVQRRRMMGSIGWWLLDHQWSKVVLGDNSFVVMAFIWFIGINEMKSGFHPLSIRPLHGPFEGKKSDAIFEAVRPPMKRELPAAVLFDGWLADRQRTAGADIGRGRPASVIGFVAVPDDTG